MMKKKIKYKTSFEWKLVEIYICVWLFTDHTSVPGEVKHHI